VTLFLLLLATGCLPEGAEDSGYATKLDADGDHWAASEDCDDADPAVHPAAPELCDGLDNDCDELTDEGLERAWYADADADGYGDPDAVTLACAPPDGAIDDATDCDDADSDVHPHATEVCDGVDDDCDERVDENLELAWYLDADGDGYGDPDDGVELCDPGSGRVANSTDCDDAAASTHPGAEELCNGVDDDCDGLEDEDTSTFYVDDDGDGFGGEAVELCELRSGHSAVAGDCDDTSGAVHPAATERCNGLDDDCDATVDEDPSDAITVYTDGDGDGFGAEPTSTGCAAGAGWSAVDGDCDDADDGVHPEAVEACNEVDDDCDDATDEDLGLFTVYDDSDGDGFGDPDAEHEVCDPSGYATDATDCDDGDAAVHPDATETWYDGTDQDCDGVDDDVDGDGYGIADDCDDTDAAVSPDATETWYDGVDQDCAGDDDQDADADGHQRLPLGSDCDDTDPAVSPDATELWYDGVDQDCDGRDDDQDGDGYGVADDCDDTDPLASPGTAETWYDRIDADCDGADDFDADGDGDRSVDYEGGDCDDQDPSRASTLAEIWYDGTDQDCDGNDADQDLDGDPAEALGGGDCDDADASVHSAAVDTWYDGTDSDCAGDDDFDADADGFQVSPQGTDCDDGDASVHVGASDTWYDGVDSDCGGDDDFDADVDGYSSLAHGGSDCDDADAAVSPGASETWYDGTDQDCDGNDDDQDGDGYPGPDEDCDDTTASTNPGASEICQNGVDDDCDGTPSGCSLSGESSALVLSSALLTGEATQDDAGDHLAVGDLDGDGVLDLVTAGPGADAAWLVFGPLDTSGDLGSLAAARVQGDAASLGADVTLLGDIDDDGLDEVGIAGPSASDGQGVVCLLDAADLGELVQADVACIDGEPDDELGSVVALQGGLLVGAAGRKDSTGVAVGGAYVYAGPITDATDTTAVLLSGTASANTGEEVAALDVDGDGFDDAVVGAPDDDGAATNAGALFLVLGPLSSDLSLSDADLHLDGPNSSAWLGEAGSLAAAGDLDDDGYDDLLAGMRGADALDGTTSDNGRVLVLLGADTPAWTLEGDAVLEGDGEQDAGGRVAAAGDVDGDGALDVLVGSPHNDDLATNAGRAWLVYGDTWSGTLPLSDAGLVLTSSTAGDELGSVGAGDVNGDGYSDLLLGAPGYDNDRGAVYVIAGGGL